jgi:hypothetical protein
MTHDTGQELSSISSRRPPAAPQGCHDPPNPINLLSRHDIGCRGGTIVVVVAAADRHPHGCPRRPTLGSALSDDDGDGGDDDLLVAQLFFLSDASRRRLCRLDKAPEDAPK